MSLNAAIERQQREFVNRESIALTQYNIFILLVFIYFMCIP
jgi:hypothetical protein